MLNVSFVIFHGSEEINDPFKIKPHFGPKNCLGKNV